MMKHVLLKCFVLICTIGLLFTLPALAEAAEVNLTAGTEAELLAAFAQASQMGADARANGQTADWVNLTITDNIAIADCAELMEGGRLRMSSAAGQHYTISSTAKTTFFGTYSGSELEMTNLTIDGSQNGSYFVVCVSGDVTIGDGMIVENFRVFSPLVPMMWGIRLNSDPTPANFVLRNCTIRNNKSVEYSGGIIVQSSSNGSMTVENCRFENNTADSHRSGALTAVGKLTVTNTSFTGNRGIGGAAIFGAGCNATLTDCTFTNNEAYYADDPEGGEGGGAIQFQNNSVVNATHCTFTGNKSDCSGGVVTLYINTTGTFTNCEFTNNSARTHGGVFCVADMFSSDDTKASHLTLNNCVLDGNKANGVDQSGQHKSDPLAPGGGAIYLHEYCTATLNQGTVLKNNYAKDSGGAVYVSFGGRLTINSAEILNNKAGLDGGAVYVDGAAAYSGYTHNNWLLPLPDDGFATGGKLFFKDGIITGNTAGRNGGGVYIGGENEVIVDGEQHIFTGGEMQMTGGVLTENTALDMGGGVYVGACDTGEKGGILDMRGGAIYLNVAGENGNTSDGADDAGADVYSEGGNAYITVVTADRITAYIRNAKNTFVPADHRDLYFTNWYDDYSDQDPTYGKMAGAGGVNTNTGRYKSSVDPHRVVYTPRTQDAAHNALILDYDRVAEVPVTGDSALPLLWLGLCLLSAVLLKRRAA